MMFTLMMCDSRGRHEWKRHLVPAPDLSSDEEKHIYSSHLLRLCGDQLQLLFITIQQLISEREFRFDYSVSRNILDDINSNASKYHGQPYLLKQTIFNLICECFFSHVYGTQTKPFNELVSLSLLNDKENDPNLANTMAQHNPQSIRDLKNGSLAERLFKAMFNRNTYPSLTHDLTNCHITDHFLKIITRHATILLEREKNNASAVALTQTTQQQTDAQPCGHYASKVCL